MHDLLFGNACWSVVSIYDKKFGNSRVDAVAMGQYIIVRFLSSLCSMQDI